MSELTITPPDPSPAPLAPVPAPPRKRRLRRIVGWTFAVLVALVLLLPVGAWWWLTSGPGERWLRQQALGTASDTIAGRLELDRVSLVGLLQVEIDGVRLFAPDETEPVVAIDRVKLDVRASALLARRVEIADLSIDKPRLHLVQDEAGGNNLQRALQLKHPSPPKEKKPEGPLPDITVHAPDIHLRDGAVQIVGPSPVDVRGLFLDGDVRGTPSDLAVKLALKASAQQPVQRDAVANLAVRLGSEEATIQQLDVQSGESRLQLTGSGRLDATQAKLDIQALTVAPSDVQALAPDVKLLGPVTLAGQATLDGRDLQSRLNLQLPAGQATLTATAQLTAPDQEGFLLHYGAQLQVDQIEPQKIVAGQPAMKVTGRMELEGSGLPPNEKARVTADFSGSRYAGLGVERLKLAAKLDGMEAQIDELTVDAADALVRASGTAGKEAGNLRFTVDLRSLEKTRKALLAGLKQDIGPVAGSLSLSGTLQGKYTSPQITASVEAPELAYEDNRLTQLAAHAQLVRMWPSPEGSFDLTLGSFAAGGQSGEKLAAKGKVDGRQALVDLTGRFAGTPLDLHLQGTREKPPKKGVERWTIENLAARAYGIAMKSEAPAVVEAGGARSSIEGLQLAGDLGRLQLTGSFVSGGAVDARFKLDGLHLEKIPAQFLPPELGLGGAMSVSATVSGTMKHPIADAEVRLADGRYQQLKPLAMRTTAHVEHDRARFDATALVPHGGTIDVSGEVPLASPAQVLSAPTRLAPPVQLAVRLDHLDAKLAQQLAPTPEPLAGVLSGSLDVTGSYAQPQATMRLAVQDAAGYGADHVGFEAQATYLEGRARLVAAVERKGSLRTVLQAEAPLDAQAALLGKKIDPMAIPIEALWRLDQLDLAWLAKLGYAPADLTGLFAGQLSATGTASAPQLDGVFRLTDAATGGYEHVDATVDVQAVQQVKLHTQVQLGGQNLLDLKAFADIAPPRLAALTQAQQFKVPFTVDAVLAPTALGRLMPKQAVQTPVEEAPSLAGTALATFHASGTADKPVVSLKAQLADLKVGGQTVGGFDLDLGYQNAKTVLNGLFQSRGAGQLTMSGSMPGDLGASAVLAEGVDKVLQRKADLRIDADKFDLALVNGLTDSVRDVAGRLNLHLEKHGPLVDPAVSGTVALEKVKMAVLEFGTFSDMDLVLDVAWPAFRLSRLSGRSGSGKFSGNAEVGPSAPGRMAGSFQLNLDEVPLVQNYQTRAYLTMKVTGEGTGEGRVIQIPKLKIANGRLRVPKPLQKAVQSLDPHPDIVFAGEEKKRQQVASNEPGWKAKIGVQTQGFDVDVAGTAGAGATHLVLDANLNTVYDQDKVKSGNEPFDMQGTVEIVRGTVEFLRRFVIDSGKIEFFPGRYTDPALDVKAHYEGNGTTVTLAVGGTAQAPTQNLSSKPPMDEGEILYFLATGQRQTRAQTDSVSAETRLQEATLGALGSAMGGAVKSVVQKILPKGAELDVLSLEADVQNRGLGRVRAGKYISDRLYIGGQYNPNANVQRYENTAEGELEYRLGEQKYFRLHVGENRSSMEILFEKNVPSEDQKKAAGNK